MGIRSQVGVERSSAGSPMGTPTTPYCAAQPAIAADAAARREDRGNFERHNQLKVISI
jgi:hypothetical protein